MHYVHASSQSSFVSTCFRPVFGQVKAWWHLPIFFSRLHGHKRFLECLTSKNIYLDKIRTKVLWMIKYKTSFSPLNSDPVESVDRPWSSWIVIPDYSWQVEDAIDWYTAESEGPCNHKLTIVCDNVWQRPHGLSQGGTLPLTFRKKYGFLTKVACFLQATSMFSLESSLDYLTKSKRSDRVVYRLILGRGIHW